MGQDTCSFVGLMLATNLARPGVNNSASGGAEPANYETPVAPSTQYSTLQQREEQSESQQVQQQQARTTYT